MQDHAIEPTEGRAATGPASRGGGGCGRWSKLALFAAMFAVVGMFYALSFYAHPQTDDFCEATDVRELGVVGTITHRYATWTGRYFYILVEANIVKHLDLTRGFWGVGVVTLTLLWLSVYAFVRSVTRGAGGAGSAMSRWHTAGLSLGLVVLYLSLLPKPVHAFYWLTGAATNQMALITLLFAFALLLRDPTTMSRGRRLASMAAAALCVAASVGSYDTTMLMLLGLLMVGSAVALVARDARRVPWLVALGAGIIGAAVVVLAPGNGVRSAMFEKAPIVQAIDYSLTNSLKWLVPYLLSPALLIAALLFLPAGWAMSRRLRAMTGGRCRWTLGLIPLWAAMIMCAWLPAQYMMQGNPPPRTLNPVSMFVLVGVFASIVVVLAQKPDGGGAGGVTGLAVGRDGGFVLPRGVLAAARVALAVALLTQGNGNAALVQLKGEARAFDHAMQHRYAAIRDAKQRGETEIDLPSSPALPTLLIHEELSADPLDYPNWAAARYWELERIVVVSEETVVAAQLEAE